MQHSFLNLEQTERLGVGEVFGQIECEALRHHGLREDAPAILCGSPQLPARALAIALGAILDLASLAAGAMSNVDVTVPIARSDDLATAALDTKLRPAA